MKRLLTILLSVIVVCESSLQAQEIRQFIDKYRGFMLYEGSDCPSFYVFGTEEIDGVEYVKEIDGHYYYRQDGNKIYCYTVAEGKESLVMDFGLKVGDIFFLNEGLNVVVEQRSDTLMRCWWTGETVCKTLYLRGIERPDFTDVWIEDVGSLRYGINPPHEGETHLIYSSLYAEGDIIAYEHDFQANNLRGMSVRYGESVSEEDLGSQGEYEAAHSGRRLTIDLRNDTLCIGGYIGGYCEGGAYLLIEEDDDDIRIGSVRYPYNDEADCRSVKVIDVRIPGFTREKYTVHFGLITAEVSQNKSLIDMVVEEKSVIHPYYDLQGRKVAHPTRGIYIKEGRKVVIK